MSSRRRTRTLFARPTHAKSLRRPAFDTLERRDVPAVFTVTSLLDDGSPGTFRDAINQANAAAGADTIDFAVTGTISLNSEIGLGDTLTIEGPGQDQLTIRASTPTFRVMSNFGTAVLEGLTIADGRAISVPNPSILDSDGGGGIINWGNLRLVNSTVTNCTSGSTDRIWWDALASAGGIMNFGGLELDDSTVSNCGASEEGGGILNRGTATLVRSTLSGNYTTRRDSGGAGPWTTSKTPRRP